MEQRTHHFLGDLLAGVILLGVVAVGWNSLQANRTLTAFDYSRLGSDPGPAHVPRILLGALGVGGAVLLMQGFWGIARSRVTQSPAEGPAAADLRARLEKCILPMVFVITLGVYLRLLFVVGFRIASVAFCTAWILVLTRLVERRLMPRHAVLAVATAVLITGAIYYVFKGFVKVPLP